MSSGASSKSKTPGVLEDALAIDRLGDRDEVVLQRPADQHLRRCAMATAGDIDHRGVVEPAAPAQRAVGLEHDSALAAVLEQRALIEERRELDLVDGRHDVCVGKQLVEVTIVEVAYADGPRVAAGLQFFHGAPAFEALALDRPVHEIEVDIVEP